MKPGVAYIGGLLWLPRERFDSRLLKSGLTFVPVTSGLGKPTKIHAWADGQHHIGVPLYTLGGLRTEQVRQMFIDAGVPIRDLRPKTFQAIDIHSKVVLDHEGKGDVQHRASAMLLKSEAGVLVLACVSGDTVLNINRAGKGSRVTVEWAFRALNGRAPRRWDLSIPTSIRSLMGDRVGLNKLLDIIEVGTRPVFLLELEDGKRLKLTEDHEVLTLHGYRSIDQGLAVGELVVIDSGQVRWGRKALTGRGKKPVYKRLNWYPSHPGAHRNGNKRGPRVGTKQTWTLEEHRAVAEAVLNGLTLNEYRDRWRSGSTKGLTIIDPTKVHVHHKDRNHLNNRPDNLELVSVKEHHRSVHPPDPRWFGYGVPTLVPIKSITPAGQETVYDVACASPHNNFVANGVVIHNCGKGKTVIALHTAAKFKRPFVIVVDNKGLQEQWAGEIRRHLMTSSGRPPEIGYVGDGRADWKKPIVIAIINSLAKHANAVPLEIRKRFCISIWDECQVLGAPEFNKAAPLFMGRRWGLSATPQRADGLEKMYYLHIGEPVFTDLMQEMKPVFYFYRTKHKVNDADPTFRGHVCPSGQVNVANLFTYLAGLRDRTAELLAIINQGVAAGRKILVLSRRLFLLEQMRDALPEAGYVWSGVSGTKREEIIQKKDVILCQMRLGERALNRPDLDMLLVCEPVKRDAVFQQIVGRVQRHRPGKPTPLVVFVEDNVGPCIGMCLKLKRHITTWPPSKGGPFSWRYTHE